MRKGKHAARWSRMAWCGGLMLAATAVHAHGATVPSAVATTASIGLAAAIGLAFVGGLILNLMPCVLPVLAIKAVGLLESGHSRVAARRHALLYTAGVLVSFLVLGGAILALRAAGHALGWGAQLQQPLVVAILVCVIVAVALSMSGVIHVGASMAGYGQGLATKSGWVGQFFTGVLAVVVASPCVAPFMGAALAYAFVAPVYAALPVLFALGAGLALPLALIGFIPALARLLPRPGQWMETLKQVLAFPMYLTAVWLVWVLANQRGANAVGLVLIAVVVLAFVLWWAERSRGRGWVTKAVTLAFALLFVVPLYLVSQTHAQLGTQVVATAHRAATNKPTIVAFSPKRLAALRQSGIPVFVDMTAKWCITCQANEHVVLDTAAFHKLLVRAGAVYMVGDDTNVSPVVTDFLHKYHSPGVPLYVVFPKGGGAGKVLPNVLTLRMVKRTLLTAARGGEVDVGA